MGRKKINETKRLTRLIAIRLKEKYYQKLITMAKESKVTKSDLLRHIIAMAVTK